MAPLLSLTLSMREEVTLDDLRAFIEHADRIGADGDQDIRSHDDNGDLSELQAFGTTTPAE